MGKAKKPRRQRLEPAALAERIRERLAAGRTKSALQDAKTLAKQSSDHADLLIEAYSARLQDLSEAGMHEEAAALLDVARARFPDEADRWQERHVGLCANRGDLTELVTQWQAADDNRERAEVATRLRQSIIDPAQVLDAAFLADDDPLKAAARAVQVAFDEAADGTLSESSRAGLRAVGRRSPFSSWRKFVLALAAYHEGEDDSCRSLLDGIAAEDSVARGKQALLAALSLECPDPAIAGIAQRLTGGALKAWSAVSAFEASGGSTELLHRLDGALRELVPFDRGILFRFARHLFPRPELARFCETIQARLRRPLGFEWFRALALEAPSPTDAVGSWCEWLAERETKLGKIGDLEFALVVDGLVAAMAHLPSVGDLGGEDYEVRWQRGELSLDELDALCQQASDYDYPQWCAYRDLARIELELEQRVVICPLIRDRTHRFLAKAAALDPTSNRYKRLISALRSESVACQDAVLIEWATALPNRPEPWIASARLAIERRAFAKASKALQRAAELAPGRSEIRELRLVVLVHRLIAHVQKNQIALGRKDFIEIRSLANGDADLVEFGDAIERFLTTREGTEQLSEETPRQRSQRLWVEWFVDDPLDRPPVALGDNWRDRMATACWMARIADRLEQPMTEPPIEASSLSGLRVEDLPTSAADLLVLAQTCGNREDRRLRALLAGAGMMLESSHLATFVALRAISFPSNAKKRIRRFLEIASALDQTALLRVLKDHLDVPMVVEHQFHLMHPRGLSDARAMLAEERALESELWSSGPTQSKKKPRTNAGDQPLLPFGNLEEENVTD